MTVQDDLFQELLVAQTAQGEFEQMVLWHFGSAKHLGNNEIGYGRKESDWALKLVYNKDGLLVRVLPGPDLKAEDIAAIKSKVTSQLLVRGPRRVGRLTAFARVPTKGCFRYKNQFQILPVPQEAPQPRIAFADRFPFLIEFEYFSSSDFGIDVQRKDKMGREVELLCSAFLVFPISRIESTPLGHWVYDDYQSGQNMTSSYRHAGYIYPGMAIMDLTDFSETEHIGTLASVDPQEYYTRRRVLIEQDLDIPANLSLLLDIFSELPRDDRDRFLRASYWFQHATHTYFKSRSAAFVGLIAAIETLFPPEDESQRCKECNRSLGPGPTQRFADFVDQHLQNSRISQAERKRFYKIRSALLHGWKLLLEDHASWSPNPKRVGEDSDTSAIWRIVQIVLHNWLLTKNCRR